METLDQEELESLKVQLNKISQIKGRKSYPVELRNRVIALIDGGESVHNISKQLNLHPSSIYGWRKKRKTRQEKAIKSTQPKIKVLPVKNKAPDRKEVRVSVNFDQLRIDAWLN